jgi:hypothetical protein
MLYNIKDRDTWEKDEGTIWTLLLERATRSVCNGYDGEIYRRHMTAFRQSPSSRHTGNFPYPLFPYPTQFQLHGVGYVWMVPWEGLRTKNLSQDSRVHGRNVYPGPPEYEAGMLTTPPWRSVGYRQERLIRIPKVRPGCWIRSFSVMKPGFWPLYCDIR